MSPEAMMWLQNSVAATLESLGVLLLFWMLCYSSGIFSASAKALPHSRKLCYILKTLQLFKSFNAFPACIPIQLPFSEVFSVSFKLCCTFGLFAASLLSLLGPRKLPLFPGASAYLSAVCCASPEVRRFQKLCSCYIGMAGCFATLLDALLLPWNFHSIHGAFHCIPVVYTCS